MKKIILFIFFLTNSIFLASNVIAQVDYGVEENNYIGQDRPVLLGDSDDTEKIQNLISRDTDAYDDYSVAGGSTNFLKSSSGLNISLTTNPGIVIMGQSFSIAMTSTNGTGNIYWHLIINKEPGDFKDYPPEETTKRKEFATTSVFPSRTSYIYHQVIAKQGTYKARLSARDERGNQSVQVLFITVSYKRDDCLAGGIYLSKCSGSGYYHPLGSKILLFDEAFVLNPQKMSVESDCHPTYEGRWGGYYLPKYDGIYNVSVEHQYPNSQGGVTKQSKRNETFHYGELYSGPIYSGWNKFYSKSVSISFGKTGVHKVRYTMRGGTHDYEDGANPINKLKQVNSSADYVVEREFFVVDCERVYGITSTSDPYFSFDEKRVNMHREIGAGTVNISHMTLYSDQERSVDAFKKIVIHPGVRINKGSKFTASIRECPYKANCSSSYLVRNSTSSNQINESKVFEIKVYPNPTTGLVNISVPDGVEVSKIEIFNNAGRKVDMSSYVLDPNIIDLSSHPSGMYLIRVYTDQGMFDSKVILNK